MNSEERPRYLNASAVAEYMSISRAMVDILVERGVLPEPIELTPRLKRWDRQAIDAALSGNRTVAPSQKTVSELSREIADGILAKRRVSPEKAPRRRH